jgi:hypothetical protein
MTVTVKRPDGGVDEYMRFGDTYFKHHDGSLDVIRSGAKEPYSYPPGQWTDVEGDPLKHRKPGFWH